MAFVSIEWLGQHVQLPADLSATQLAADLVKVGLEEEAIHTSGVTGPLVCGRVVRMSSEEQSNGKTINYCRVDVGPYNDAPGEGKEPSDIPSRSIICGAHNFKEGDHVVVSLPGAVLPGGFEIATRKTYGHISDGMICSAREMGLGQDHSGIIVLEEYLAEKGLGQVPEVGTNMLPILGLADELLEINITPDRGYCFSMRGVAREYAHSTGAKFTDPGLAENLPGGAASLAPVGEEAFAVEVDDTDPIRGNVGCDRFATRIVRGVNPAAPSPEWMVKRLESAGMRSISLAVDITNYLMLDLGQPMHAYDLDQVEGPIVVRRARAGETLTTLDDVERQLDPQDLLITDSQGGRGARVLGLAGVMGGASTEVSAQTTNILLEAAHFDQVSVARTMRRHKLPTEAGKRFERGTDPLLPPVAIQRAVELLVEYGGGVADAQAGDLNQLPAPRVIEMAADLPQRMIGLAYPPAQVREILTQIGCQVEGEETLQVTVPSWRPDLVGPAHLVEEVARLAGYDQIPTELPVGGARRGLPVNLVARREIARTLAEAGLTEVLSYPFISPEQHDRMGLAAEDSARAAVKLANPLAGDQPYLRTSILDTLLESAARNVGRGNPQVALFEIDQVASAAGVTPAAIPGVEGRPSEEELKSLRAGTPKQPWHLGVVLAGAKNRPDAFGRGRDWDWADAIGLALRVASSQGLTVHAESSSQAPFHPGRCAKIRVGLAGGKVLATAGELHPRVCKEFGLPARTCALEFDLEALEKARGKDAIQVQALSTFPVAKEDLAFVVDADMPAEKVRQAIIKPAREIIEEVRLFDVYTGEQVGEGKKSLAFALRLRAAGDTLGPQQIAEARARIIKQVEKTCKATLRA